MVNGVQTTLDQFRGTPYMQVDMRVSRPITLRERWVVMPFIEFFNLFNRNNPGANYVTDLAALPTPVNNLFNATAFCQNAACTRDHAHHQSQATAGSLRRLGRFLRTRHNGGDSVRRADRRARDVSNLAWAPASSCVRQAVQYRLSVVLQV